MLATANRDPAEFPEPDRFHPRRGAIQHLAFGAGAHACVGAALIRMAATCATAAFLDHFAGAELCEPIEWRGGFAIRSPAEANGSETIVQEAILHEKIRASANGKAI